MKRLIRNRDTGNFFDGVDGWTPDFKRAQPFPSIEDAYETVVDYHLQDAELYYSFEGISEDYSFSLSFGEAS